MPNLDYWAERATKAQEIITKRNTKELQKQLARYYKRSMDRVVKEFELTYQTYLATERKGLENSPATLYRLDTYWNMQAQIKEELQKLGDKQALLFSNYFTKQYRQIYRAAAIKDDMGGFRNISADAAEQIIKQIWCADGSSWTSRIWKNTEQLRETLNDGLVDCIITGAPRDTLKKRLMERFGVSYSKADTIVRTEMNHIQNQAARQRYADAGIQEIQVWADKDERRCEICAKLHKKRYPVGAQLPLPAHPRCRCRIIPYIEIEPSENEQLKLEDF